MRVVICLLIAIAAACGAYTLGAIAWSALDPKGAAPSLLFTIPVALAATLLPALLAVFALVASCKRGVRVPRAKRAPASAPARPQHDEIDYEDLQIAA